MIGVGSVSSVGVVGSKNFDVGQKNVVGQNFGVGAVG